MVYQMLRKKMDAKYDPTNLTLDEYDYSEWFRKKSDDEESMNTPQEDVKIFMPSLDIKEIKEGHGIKILTPNKLLTRFATLLLQIKAGNNLCKLKK